MADEKTNQSATQESSILSSNNSDEAAAVPVAREHNRFMQFFLASRKLKPIPAERERSPEETANFLSKVTWSWLSPLMRTGYNRILEINDVWRVPDRLKNEHRLADFNKRLDYYKAKGGVPYQEFWAMLYALRYHIILCMILTLLYVGGELGMSLISRSMIEAVEELYYGTTTNHGPAVGYCIGNTLVSFSFQICLIWMGYYTRYYAELCRTMLITAIYQKVVRLSPQGRQLYPASKITSLITTDTNRIFMASRWTPLVVFFLPAFGGTLGLLVHNIGVASLTGCALVLLGVVVNFVLSRLITMFRKRSLPFADRRIAAVRETVENMRVIKFYGWEDSFVKLISKARAKEAGFLKRLGLLEGLTDAMLTSMPTFAGVLSFAIRTVLGKNLNPAQVFPSLTLFQLFIPYTMMFSQGLTSHADAYASLVRLNDFFRAPEEPSYVENCDLGKDSVEIHDGYFKWDVDSEPTTKASKRRWRNRLRLSKRQVEQEASETPAAMLGPHRSPVEDEYYDDKEKEVGDRELERAGAKKFPGLLDINLDVRKGELLMVVGSIGSGKSTLLSAILGNISKQQGSVKLDGIVSSVMSTWSQNDTIRNNILFGKPYEAERYAQVVHVCSLESDFQNFPARDFSEVGERGITLSGGQKARIALARCIYNGGDIILLDDVLSAVDGKVANHIFKKCIEGYVRHSTRIMATHNLKLLEHADRVVYMPGDGHAIVGTLGELQAKNPAFKEMYLTGINAKEEDTEDEPVDATEYADDTDVEAYRTISATSASSAATLASEVVKQLSRPTGPSADAKLMQNEERARGRVTGNIVFSYLNSGSRMGIAFVGFIVVFAACVATGTVMQTVWLNFWTSDRFNHSNGFYIGIYCLIIALRMAFFLCLAVSVCVFCFNSSSKLHNLAVENIYRAPMVYFDSTPLGRIINRFTDDTANLDTQLYMQLRMFLFSSSMLIASLVVVFVYVPWVILALIPILITSLVVLNYYRATSRELKRINSLFRSKMFSLVMETVSGLSVILAYRRQGFLSKELNVRIDDMNYSFRLLTATQYWLALRVIVSTQVVSLLTIMLAVFQVFNLSPSTVGMLLTLLPSVSISVAMMLPMFAELENQMNSVERLHELAHSIPQEAPYHIAATQPPADWPQRGSIKFEDVSLRYRENLPLVLDNMSLNVKGGEKIGIVGRTGAGKSTILSALFRLTEVSDGRIVIDDVDIANIGLGDLRQKLAIIPQEPVLFQGTIRFNLDPFNNHTDLELWDALRRSGVIRENEIVAGKVSPDHKFHLDTKIDSDGSNLSLGERQLLTLARAMVRQSKILVLDEATATVDFDTDRMIQATISKEFASCTILCIAHRLLTILHYDQIVVMDAGRIAEMGPPHELFKDPTTAFHAMCQEYKITEEDFSH